MAYAAPVFLQAQSAITTPDQINPVGVLVISSKLLGTYFHCVWCCSALFYLWRPSHSAIWAKSKRASFQSLLFLFISQCPQQQSGCATFWGMMRKPCPHPLYSLRWTRCNSRATSWSGKNQLGIKTYTQRHHLLEIKTIYFIIFKYSCLSLLCIRDCQWTVSMMFMWLCGTFKTLLSSVAIKLPSRVLLITTIKT